MGDLVCIKSWNVDDAGEGWYCDPTDYGIVIEIIEIEHDYVFIDKKIRCFDYRIYWMMDDRVETLPDIIIQKYSDYRRMIDE